MPGIIVKPSLCRCDISIAAAGLAVIAIIYMTTLYVYDSVVWY